VARSGEDAPVVGGEGSRASGRRRITPVVHLPTWSRLTVSSKQRSVAGKSGDFFEVIQHRDGLVSTFLADVCGNGPPAAAHTHGMRWVLRQKLAHGGSPGELLAALNDWLVDQHAPDLFVTAVCFRVEPTTGGVEVASAGHLGPFIKRAAGKAELIPLSPGTALGIIGDQSYEEVKFALEPEDAIVLCTDGITDRLSTEADPLGAGALVARLARSRPGAENICAALLGPDVPVSHDSTVVVAQLPRRHRRASPVPRRK
jgi:two-component system, chemotaxis family, sensor kinase Cph1